MCERPDDTTEGAPGSRPARPRAPGRYYYDDATGYEVYDPGEDTEETGDDPAGADEGEQPPSRRQFPPGGGA